MRIRGDGMNPGFISVWIVIMALILFATGWREYLAPGISRRTLIVLGAVSAIMLMMPLWIDIHLRPGAAVTAVIHIHAAIILLLLAGMVTGWGDEGWNNKLYLVLCGVIVGLVWGIVRKLYSYDPVFYWLGPSWDAPILSGALCGICTSNGRQQFGVMIWGAVIGEFVYALLYKGIVMTSIGSVAWWDRFLVSLVAASLASVAHRAVRMTGSKISDLLLNYRGGRSS